MLANLRESNVFYFLCQMIFLTAAICLIPTFTFWLTRKNRHRSLHAAVETILFTALFLSFGFWLFGARTVENIAIYVFGLILLLEIGSNIVEWHKELILNRLSQGTSFKNLKNFALAIEKMFENELILYIALPIGFFSSTIIGLFLRQTPQEIVVFSIRIVLLLASCVLLYFLILGFFRMCEPMFRTSQVTVPEIKPKKRKGFWSRIYEIVVPHPKPKIVDQEQQDINMAVDISELRKVYKFESLHNAILFVTFIATILRGINIEIDSKWVVACLLAATLFFVEMPYGIGQYFLHQKVLERYTGSKYAEIAKKLADCAPIFPPWAFLASLMTTGTAGGFLYFLLSQFVQTNLTNILK